jgi:LysM repeat protein
MLSITSILLLLTVALAQSPPGPTQAGQPASCDKWDVAELGDSCTSISSDYGLSLGQFLQWNPAINNACTTGLLAGYAYCVGVVAGRYPYAPGPTLAGEPTDCDEWYTVQPGDTCPTIAFENGISITQFLSWNPSVNPSCTQGLVAGYSYCVGVAVTTSPPPLVPPGPTQPGEAANCDRWYVAQAGDTCETVSTSEGITFGELLDWNPIINPSCTSGFIAGYAYCVGVE